MPRKPKPPRRRVRGSGTVTVLKNGTIRARLPASIDPRRTAREFRPGQRAQAEAWLAAALDPQPAVPDVSITLEQWAAQWWTDYVAAIRPLNTARKYRWALAELSPLDAMRLTDVRATHLQGVVGLLAARVSPDTLAAAVGVWRRCLEDAVEDGLIGRNPARRLTLPAPRVKAERRHVTADEIARLWPAIVGTRFEAAYALALGCGLRIGEILGLHWASVDWVGHRIWVQHQYTNGHWRDEPKGHNPHWIPLPAQVAVVLRRQFDRRGGNTIVMQSPFSPKNSEKFRKTPKNSAMPRPWSRQVVANDLHAIVARLQLAPLVPHSARHGIVTRLLEGGVSAAVVAQRVGHRSPVTTQTFYQHPTVEGSALADELVDAYLTVCETDESGDMAG